MNEKNLQPLHEKFWSVVNRLERECDMGFPQEGWPILECYRESIKNNSDNAQKYFDEGYSFARELLDLALGAQDKAFIGMFSNALRVVSIVEYEWSELDELGYAQMMEAIYRSYGAEYCVDYGESLYHRQQRLLKKLNKNS